MIRSYLTDRYTNEVHLLALGLTWIGRGPRVEVLALGTSRTHCALVAGEEGRVLSNDLGSKKGTRVDELRIERTEHVAPGRSIQVGQKCFVLGQVDLSDVGAEQRALIMSRRVFQALVAEGRQSA